MENGIYDDNLMFSILKEAKTYEEMRLQCDLQDIECIVTRNEFNYLKNEWKRYYDTNSIFSPCC